ncbi:protein spitz-like [Ctenocephalides felis]|uniref:protein spitz-like n=1 Tax=Ctenocephalides felis TaxID=7515 RepID=UPI000E6E4C2D|nr:protein spitz-like [Ctenocephalides felis]
MDGLDWAHGPEFALLAVICLCTTTASRFYRFLARFSGRRRKFPNFVFPRMPSPLATLLFIISTLLSTTDACSSRSTPRAQPAPSTPRPNVTFTTYPCPTTYNAWYCLNGAVCFSVKIGDSVLYNCECADGYMGPRCEYKDLDGSYLPSRQRIMLETASIAGGATIAVLLVLIICAAMYVNWSRRQKVLRASRDCVDGPSPPCIERRPFGPHHHHTIPMERIVLRPPQQPMVLAHGRVQRQLNAGITQVLQ